MSARRILSVARRLASAKLAIVPLDNERRPIVPVKDASYYDGILQLWARRSDCVYLGIVSGGQVVDVVDPDSFDEAILERHRKRPPAWAGGNDSGVEVTRLADVESKTIAWLWDGRIPLGMLTVLDGDPGLGKST